MSHKYHFKQHRFLIAGTLAIIVTFVITVIQNSSCDHSVLCYLVATPLTPLPLFFLLCAAVLFFLASYRSGTEREAGTVTGTGARIISYLLLSGSIIVVLVSAFILYFLTHLNWGP